MRLINAFFKFGVALTLSAAGGCGAVGTVLHTAFGEPPVDAQYHPQERPTLVMVENRRDPDSSKIDGDQIAHQVTIELTDKTKLAMIDPDKVAPMRESDAEKYSGMSIPAVGRAVDAKQIIYVDLVQADSSADATGSVVHAVARARVRVVDAETGNVLWPVSSQQGLELSADEDYDPVNVKEAQTKRNKMLTDLSSRIAKLFYNWKPEDQYQEDAGG